MLKVQQLPIVLEILKKLQDKTNNKKGEKNDK